MRKVIESSVFAGLTNGRKRAQTVARLFRLFYLLSFFLVVWAAPVFAQNYAPQFAPGQQTKNYLKNSAAFRQEIARMEINVVRAGKYSLPITQVPRVQKDDVIKVRMLDEAVGGIKPDQSNWDWTFLVAFVNPNRNHDKEKSVSEEIRFRKTGWYKEYSFQVPYDAQPVFFLYPKPNYRGKDLKSDQQEVRGSPQTRRKDHRDCRSLCPDQFVFKRAAIRPATNAIQPLRSGCHLPRKSEQSNGK